MRVATATRAKTQIPCELIDPGQNPDVTGLDALLWCLYESLMTGRGGAVRGPAIAGREWVASELGVSSRTLDDARGRLLAGGWLTRSLQGAKRKARHYATRIPRETDGCYVEVPAWWAKRVQPAHRQEDGSTRPASDYVRPDAWWLLVRIVEMASRCGWLDGGPGRPGVTVAYLAALIGARSGKTGQRRLAELEAAGLVDVATLPGGRLFVRPVWSPQEAAELADRYAREGRRVEAQNSPTSGESHQPQGPRTPDRICESPRTESASHPGQNLRVHRSQLQVSHLELSQSLSPAVGELQEVDARASTADAGQQDRIIATETPRPALSRPESTEERPAGPERPTTPLRGVSGDHSVSPARPRRTQTDQAAVEAFRAIPEALRSRLPEHGSRRVLAAIAAELATGHRSAAELVDRIAAQGDVWRYRVEDVRDVTAVVISSVVRRGYDCPDVRCEDRRNLDTGQDCRACQEVRAAMLAPTPLNATETAEPPLSGIRTPSATGSPVSDAPSAPKSTPIPPPYVRPASPRIDHGTAGRPIRDLISTLRADLEAKRTRPDSSGHRPA